MQCGSKVLEGYVPEFDADVVTRILDAGEYRRTKCFSRPVSQI